ncbi:MAG: G5 domain-containing protein [Lachnospiraceae bacterium]|nr:G5 domain-containing protein [Lachnospiraceae bacterium]
MRKKSILTAVFLTVCGLCTGCVGGGAANTIEISILDGQVETQICVAEGETVEAILKEAEITLNEDDVVTPAVSEVYNESDGDIVIDRCVSVTVKDGEGEATSLTVTGGRVSDALEAAEISLNVNDVVNHNTEAWLSEGMEIEVERWYGVTIILNETVFKEASADGDSAAEEVSAVETEASEDSMESGMEVEVNATETYVVTQASTVEELLSEQNLSLGENDQISLAGSTTVEEGMEISISRANKTRITEEEELDYETVYENSSSLYTGKTSVKQEGEKGLKQYVYELTYVDGELVDKTLISEEVVKEPVDEIILKGTKKKSSSSSSKKVVSKKKVYDCDGSGHGYYIITYSDGSVSYEDF